MKNYSVRTDLALEEKERFASDNVEVQGVVLEEEYDEENEIRLTRVVIETENGAKIMGKPTGIYLTLESPDLALEVEENSRVLQERICDCIRELIFHKISCEDGKELKILFVGLGNRAVTPDALGPYVADRLEVNRHIVKEYGKYAMRTEQLIVLSAIVPGVMGQTGMETAEIVRGIVHETKPDLILLDLMLPEVDGFDICRQVRQEKNTPIIMVSAKKDDIDKIRGLGLGADDYMTKPFSPSELVARVKAHMDRYNRLIGSNVRKNDIVEIRGIKIDKTARRVWVNGEEKTFTSKEYDLLTFLAENPNRVFTKEELFREIWDMESVGDIATVTVHIKKIREKIEFNTAKPQYIETIWGVGYRFKV